MSLEGKVILVTGGDGLLGKAIINNIRQKGGMAISLDISHQAANSKTEYFVDLLRNDSIQDCLTAILKDHSTIDGLVNNAYPRTSDWGSSFENTTPSSFSLNIDMQLSRVFAITKPVLEVMKDKGKGALVHIASIYGIVGNDFTVYDNTEIQSPAAYSAIKGGLINFNRYLASYFGKFNIRSNCVSPGGIFDNQDQTFVRQYEYRVPMKRMGNPDDIAPAVSFLLSDEARYITGQNIAVDGGWTAI